tara:strand:+ start:65 stop:490 length:426 start_codon:yes stop_codon:yes gene_type:complete
MTPRKVDFYVYELSDYQFYQRLVCNLVEEAYNQENNILLLCENEESCETLDELLWTFKDVSFIPHEKKLNNKILTQHINLTKKKHSLILMNLTYSFPDFLETHDRVIEMSGYDEDSRQKARLNFKRYKTMNFEINSVPIKP